MGDELTGLVAVTLALGAPIALMYTYYRVRKLKTEERIAAMARGIAVPMEPELSQLARSRRWGILLTAGALGFMATCSVLAHYDPDARMAAAFGFIPLALGLGCFVDAYLVRRDVHAS